jgi:UDP-glucose 4-epimerase
LSRVLVTGGAGFIGSNVAVHLSQKGYDIVALDDLARSRPLALRRLREERIPILRGDIRNLRRSVLVRRNVSQIVHFAALTSVPESVRDPKRYHDVNAGGTLSLLIEARRADVRHLVNISSAAVYGSDAPCPVSESDAPQPDSPYGASKLAAEAYALSIHPRKGIVTNLRLFNVYGPDQNPHYSGVIDVFARRAVRGAPLTIFGSGRQTRDFIHVSDVARAIETVFRDKCVGAFNVGSGSSTSVLELARTIRRVAESRSPIRRGPAREGDILHSRANIHKLTRHGWRPRVPFDQGIRELIHYLRAR